MRRSQLFLPTLKETPSEAQIVSHRLMLRARVGAAQVGVLHVRPEERRPLLRLDRQVELREMRLAAAIGLVQVDEECEEAHATQRVGVAVLVVVRLVELARLVA